MTLGQLTSKCLRAHGGPDAEISLLTGSPFPGNSGAALKDYARYFPNPLQYIYPPIPVVQSPPSLLS